MRPEVTKQPSASGNLAHPAVDKRALRSLTEFVVKHGCPLGLVINNDERPRWLDERILVIPAASF